MSPSTTTATDRNFGVCLLFRQSTKETATSGDAARINAAASTGHSKEVDDIVSLREKDERATRRKSAASGILEHAAGREIDFLMSTS